jgi:large conductance mechanosensitive channel
MYIDTDMEERGLIGKKEIQEYKNFAFRDDMLKLAVGVVLGNSFNKVVYGISDYLVMPVLTFLVSQTGDEWRRWEFIPFFGLKFEFGRMLGTFVDFILMSFFLYLFYVKFASRIIRPDMPKRKECPLCHENIRLEATKCPFCTGDISVETRRVGRQNKRAENRRGK